MTTPVNLTEMDYNAIKENLKEFLRGQSEFSDYNFEGAGLSFILSLLAYNSQNNAYLANMLANEAEIDSAVIRANVVSRAKLMGYTPKSISAARAAVAVSINDPLNAARSLLMPRGTKFVASAGGSQYTFVTLQDYNLALSEETGLYSHPEIEVFEGKIKNFSWNVFEGARFIFPSSTVDVSTVRVLVFDNQNTNTYKHYIRSHGVNQIDETSSVFWLYETDGGSFEIRFGDGVFGSRPANNGVVYAEYLETTGADANSVFRFGLAGSFAGYDNNEVSITTVLPSSGGADAEATSSIKLNAPRFLSAQGRAVTTEDFVSVTHDIYPTAKSVHVWGGEDETPPQYGKVFVAIIPQTSTRLTSATKKSIENGLRRKCIVGIRPVVVDPKYINLNLSLFVDMNRSFIESAPSLATEIKARVEEYFDSVLSEFDQDFYYSKFVEYVNRYSKSIVSCRANLRLSIVEPAYLSASDYDIQFTNEIKPGSITSSRFTLTGAQATTSLSDEDGILKAGGIVVGAVDYATGSVTFTIDIQSAEGNAIEVFATPIDTDIKAERNAAIVLQKNRTSIDLRAV